MKKYLETVLGLVLIIFIVALVAVFVLCVRDLFVLLLVPSISATLQIHWIFKTIYTILGISFILYVAGN